ncbi:unnamed protein product [Lampetra fluviatilis]
MAVVLRDECKLQVVVVVVTVKMVALRPTGGVESSGGEREGNERARLGAGWEGGREAQRDWERRGGDGTESFETRGKPRD